jgi:hypothetical protein
MRTPVRCRDAVKIVCRPWNGQYGRLVRRDIWLYTDDQVWRVEDAKAMPSSGS